MPATRYKAGKTDITYSKLRELNEHRVSFPTGRAWYDSPAYQAAAKHRLAGSMSRAFFIEGV